MMIGEKYREYCLIDGKGMFVTYDVEPTYILKFQTLEEAVKERAEYAAYMEIPESDIGILLVEETVVA